MRALCDNRLRLSPSDLNNFLACRHLTSLDLRRARGEIVLDKAPRPDAALIAEKGQRHEEAFLNTLRVEGRQVVAIPTFGDNGADPQTSARATEQAMRGGAEVVYQAAFLDDDWLGFADFLIRIDEPSELGQWSYEAYDTKLARYPKPYFILQLAFYTEQIGRIQGRMPVHMHVVLGSREVKTFRYDGFAAYVAHVRRRFLDALASDEPPPYPYPVEHCDYCDWWKRCKDKRRADDHLSLVADLTRHQSIRLEDGGIETVAALAALPDDATVQRLPRTTVDALHQQARLQVYTRETGERIREFLPLEQERGFQRLPTPSAADVFFDIEGDPYWGDDGLEYLLGTWTEDGGYEPRWAHDEPREQEAFEDWVDWVTARLAQHSDLHIYHYNHYEPTALKRLMSKYGTREAEVDELLRRKVFCDLYVVVRQAMRIGQESYSLKALEGFYPFDRDAEVTQAGGSILAYEDYLDSRDPAQLEAIAEYNDDDCRSTYALRNWLLDERAEAERQFDTVLPSRDAIEAKERSPEAEARLAETARLKDELTAGLPEEEDERTPDQRTRQLMADLLEYHRREAKPEWWAYFDRIGKMPGELVDDTEAVGDIALDPDLPLGEEAQSYVYPLRFPPQQHKLGPGKVIDPETEKQLTLKAIDDARGIAWLKRGKKSHGKPLPRALAPIPPIDASEQEAALKRVAHRVLAAGPTPAGRLDAAIDLLTVAAPRIDGIVAGEALQHGNADIEEIKGQVARLRDGALFVQGPPGAGKTWTGARLAVDALTRSWKVGVAATSHKAIHNMLVAIEKAADEAELEFEGLKKGSSDNPESFFTSDHIETSTRPDDFPPPPNVGLIAGTPWLFAREALQDAVDVLLVDEAGQVALADALAISGTARNVVLLGDPQQLAHVSHGMHPHGSGRSVLEHLLGDRATVEADRGVFLDLTRRMHPLVCRFVSDVMYEGRLHSQPGCDKRWVESTGLGGAGLRFLPVEHEGNRQQAPEEAQLIADEIERLLAARLVGFDHETVTLNDILVVAPYNAQVRCLRAKLPDGARIGTVDKFQGQEAPVVFFSMTSSSGDDVPRGMDFLFSRNRLNVAVSRAQCLAAVVCAPALLTTRCNSVDQMRLVNALCRFDDMAADEG